MPGALHPVLPWLWQLADEDVVKLQVPSSLAKAMVAALRSVPENEAAAAGGNLRILISTLEWTWGLDASSANSVPPQGGPSSVPVDVPPTVPGSMPQKSQMPAPKPIKVPPSAPQPRQGLPPMSPAVTHAHAHRRPELAMESPRSVHRRRSSTEGMQAMQAQLDAMQAELLSSPRPRG